MAVAVNLTTSRLIESYLAALDCPRSLAIWLMFTNNEHDQIISLGFEPNHYRDYKDFRDAYLATKFLSKANFLSTSVDRKQVAIDGFKASEIRCQQVNKDDFRTACKKHRRFEWLHRAIQQTIRSILTDFTADEFFDSANWGPGVTLLIKRDTSATNKFRLENGITRSLHSFVGGLFSTAYPNWPLKKFKIQKGNKIVTVPKNSKTDRTIAVEPGINLWFQKSLGSMIRRRLSRFGLDLNSQARNQHLAYIASKYGNLATVDFSAASDTIAYSTVRELLPSRWFTLLDLVRSEFGSIEGDQVVKYEKFSSMGNGSTFELESLIFYAIALECTKYLKEDVSKVSVYGDDVLIPVKVFDLFRSICDIYGFSVNPDKSYSSGPFRESCGSHFYNGLDCKPYYLKEVVRRESEIYVAGNSIRRLARDSFSLDSRFFETWSQLFNSVPPNKRCLISEGYGDVGFIVDFDEAQPPRARDCIEGYLPKALLTVPKGYVSSDHALLLARLKDCSVRQSDIYITESWSRKKIIDRIVLPRSRLGYGNVTFLRSKVRHIRKRILIQRWSDFGPWI